MTLQLPALWGALRYEFRMQIRRPTVWITFALFTLLMIALFQHPATTFEETYTRLLKQESLQKVLADWAFNINNYLPICVGALLAGRLPRDRRTRVDELFTTMPTTRGTRLWGKLFGAMLATTVPMFLIYLGGVCFIASYAHNLLAIPLAFPTFIVVALPGLIFISAFSLACTAFLWSPLYQFLFICYWYWNTLWFHTDLVSLSRTLLSPIGLYTVMGIYGLNESSSGQHPIHITGTPLQAIASILLLIATAVVAMLALDGYLNWRQAQQ
jgi:hypothetical protein